MYGTVAEQPGDRGAVEAGTVDHLTAPAGGEVLELYDHVDVRAVPTATVAALVVEEEAAHVDQRIGSPSGHTSGQVGSFGHGQANGSSDDGAGLGAECSVDDPAIVESAGQVQRPFWLPRLRRLRPGTGQPGRHRPAHAGDGQRHEVGHQFRLLGGEISTSSSSSRATMASICPPESVPSA